MRTGTAVAGTLLLVLLTGLLGYVKLRHGPISLKYLTPSIERSIASEIQGFSLKMEEAALALGDSGGLEFQLRNLSIREADGDTVASAPLASAELSLKALRDFRIVPARIDLIKPRLVLLWGDDGRLSLTIRGGADSKPAAPRADRLPGAGEATPPLAAEPATDVLKRIDIAKTLAEAAARARQRIDASSYLREIGIRDATVEIEAGGRTSQWRVPDASLDLEHKKGRSVIAGHATVMSAKGPWTLNFRTQDNAADKTLAVAAAFRDLVPRTLGEALPKLAALVPFDLPLSGDMTLRLSAEGDIAGGQLDLELGRGSIGAPGSPEVRVPVDAGRLSVGYDGGAARFDLQPSTVRWGGGSQITLTGQMTRRESTTAGGGRFAYALQGQDGLLAAADMGSPALPIEAWSAEGELDPSAGILGVRRMVLKAGGSEVGLDGEVALAGAGSARVEGRIGPMSAATAKTVWPVLVAPGARRWIGKHLEQANVRGGSFRYLSGSYLKDQAPAAGDGGRERIGFTLEATDILMRPVDTMSPVEAPRALVRLENHALEVTIPDAAAVLDKGRRLPLKSGRFAIADVSVKPAPEGEVSFRALSPLGPVMELIDQEPLTLMRKAGLTAEGLDGKVDGTIKLTLPLVTGVRADQVKVEGKVRISDGRMKQVFGSQDVQGAVVNIDINGKAVDATGEMLVAGVPAKLAWQRIFDAPADKQPPLRITASLDNADRNQLGLDVNSFVQGEVPVEVTLTRNTRDEPLVRVRAELTGADIALDGLGWRKPPGRNAVLQFEVAKGRTHKTELQNLKVAGDDIAIEGWAALGADNKLKEFYFPDFSLNVVTRLEVQGTAGGDGVWQIKAKGPTWDGRDYFRSLFSVGQVSERPASQPQKSDKAAKRSGLDIDVEIDTVIGFSEVSLKSLKLRYQSRNEKMTSFDAKGQLDGGHPLVLAFLQQAGQPRRLLADTTDAGQAFKLIGFYPNLQGGRARLEINVDGKGPAEKTGTLWVESFRVLGDPIVSEVVGSNLEGPGPEGGRRETRVVRQAFDFDRMRLPFSVGHNQFVLEDSYANGPLLGATLRGKVDFKAKALSLGGTYIPLQGLNNVLGGVPLIGPLISGPRGEGIFGITFAVQGALANPQVIVNPLSIVAPGIFREIFQMTNPNPSIQIREERPAAAPETRVRSSSSPAAAGAPVPRKPDAARSSVSEGWSSETKPAAAPQKK